MKKVQNLKHSCIFLLSLSMKALHQDSRAAGRQNLEWEDPVSQAAREHFGIPYLFPYQRLVISNVLEAAGYFEAQELPEQGDQEEQEITDGPPRQQLVVLPTGAGKSLCFMLPGVLLADITLLIFPLLSLMADQLRRLDEQGIPAALLSGGQDRQEKEEIWRRAAGRELKFLLSNPETLIQPRSLEHLRALPVAHVVLDEAHTIPTWGVQFRESLLRVPEIIQACRPHIVSAFTATASEEIETDLQALFAGPETAAHPASDPKETVDALPLHVIRANPDRPNISYHVIESLCKMHDLRRLLDPEYRYALPRPAIVFCATRKQAQRCAMQLRRSLGSGEIFFYHAGLEREEKQRIQKWFFHSDDGILTATNAFGMGVDKADVRSVIHFNVSRSVEAFLQESGRGGRDTKPAYSVVLYDAYDTAAAAGSSDRRYSRLLEALSNSHACVREALMAAMGSPAPACSGCDTCLHSRPTEPMGFREILNFFHVYPRRFNCGEAAEILCGENSIGELRRGYRHFFGFGSMREWSKDEVKAAVKCLEAAGSLKKPRRGVRRGYICQKDS
ncbi:MAG: RecQ family ATP-dependent DNA helicase [Spirochaetia bacterium]|nr:RecQ family ATP-dependent DNA helicase [Spirochaetia bacterium]